MAQNKRKLEREFIALMKQGFTDPEYNVPTEEEIHQIKEKLSLASRTEDDWCVIKDILNRRSVICMEPDVVDDNIDVIDHILFHEGRLVVFTNVADACAYMKEVKPEGVEIVQYTFGSLPFFEACETADKNKLQMYIDPPTRNRIEEKFIAYQNDHLTAVLAVKPDSPELLKIWKRAAKQIRENNK